MQGLLFLIHHDLFDHLHEDLILYHIVVPTIVPNDGRLALKDSTNVTLLAVVSFFNGFYDCIDQLLLRFWSIFVKTDFQDVIKCLWRYMGVLFSWIQA